MQPSEQAIWQRLKALSAEEAVNQILKETAETSQSSPYDYFYSCKRLSLSRIHQQKLAQRFLNRLDYGEHTFFKNIMAFIPLDIFLEAVSQNFDSAHDKKLVQRQIETAANSLKFSGKQMELIDSALLKLVS